MKLLMCPPDYFDVEYEINPWMDTTDQVDKALAKRQWQQLYDLYTETLGWDVQVVDAVANLPDMTFTANAGLVMDGKVAVATFRHPERQPESRHFGDWFRGNGWVDTMQPVHDFEGEGDALLWNGIIFAGHPWRSDQSAHKELATYFDREIVSLQLTDARFYHLDTCFAPVSDTAVALWPGAFTDDSIARIRQHVPDVIEAGREDALAYGLNSVSDGKHVVLSDAAEGLITTYKDMGMHVHPVPVSEFRKSGGGVKCLTLDIGR